MELMTKALVAFDDYITTTSKTSTTTTNKCNATTAKTSAALTTKAEKLASDIATDQADLRREQESAEG